MAKRQKVPDLVKVLNRLKDAKRVVIDTETSGLDWKRNHIVGWVFTFGPRPDDSYYIPVRHKPGGNIVDAPPPQNADGWNGKPLDIEKEFVRLLNRPGVKVQGHNLSFDLKFLWRMGMTEHDARFEDSILNAPLLDEWQPRFSLEYCAQIAGVEAKKSKEICDHIARLFPEVTKDHMGHYWRLAGDDPIAVDYATGDGTSTWQLIDWQMPQIQEQQLDVVHDIESRLLPVLVRMSCKGIKIDEARLAELLEHVDVTIAQHLKQFPKDFNVRSPADVKKWMEDHGATDWPLTEKKAQPSFPEQFLLKHECGRQIVDVRKLSTLRNTFLVPMRDHHIFRGRVHTTFHQLRGDEFGVVTGRLSSTDPNMQAVSKRDKKMGRLHRSIFVADAGHTWCSADYVQCEPVLLAVYSRCKVLVDGYTSDPPLDAHQAVANATGLDRQTGKRVNQTLITGGGKNALMHRYGMTEEEALTTMRDYFAKMPEIKTLQKNSTRTMRHRGYVISLLGRRARLRRPDLDYQAMNRLLQCGNADIIKLKMVQIDDYLKSEGRPLDNNLNIHDDLSFQFKKSARKHLNECLRIMSDFSEGQPIELDIPLRTDPGEGKTWAIATYGPEEGEDGEDVHGGGKAAQV